MQFIMLIAGVGQATKEGQYTQIINPFLLLNLLLLIDFFSPLLHHFRLTF